MPWIRSVDEFKINQGTTGAQGVGQVTALSGGGFVVVWSSPHSGGTHDIYARKYGADGLPEGDEFIVSTAGGGTDIRPDVVAFPGGFHVVWQRTENNDLDVLGRSFFDGGTSTDEFLLHGTTTAFQSNPTVAGDLAAYASGTSVFVTGLGAGAADVLISAAATANTMTCVQQLAGTAGASGTYLISYQGADGSAKAKIYNTVTGNISTEITLSTTEPTPQVHALGSGGFVTTTGFPDVRAQIFDANGVPVGAQIDIAVDPNAAETQGDALALSSGGFVVFWTVYTYPTEVYAQRFTDTGIAFGSELKLTLNLTDGAAMPQVSEMSDGRLVVTYQSTRGGEDDLYAQVFGLPQNTVLGTAADEAIYLGALDDTLFGKDGNDVLKGMEGHDLVEGQNGNDTVFGGFGNDTVTGGNDRDKLYGGRGNDVIEGGRARDLLDGGRGKDTMNGGDGKDTLRGGDGRDLLDGEAGHDYLKGEDGKDRLTGGTGNDVLLGGADADVFVFRTGDGVDTILDFTDGEDRIRIESGAADFSDITVTDLGADARITFGDVTVNLTGVDHVLIDAGDFIF